MPGQSTSTGRKNVLAEDFMKEVEDESVRKPQWNRRSRTAFFIIIIHIYESCTIELELGWIS